MVVSVASTVSLCMAVSESEASAVSETRVVSSFLAVSTLGSAVSERECGVTSRTLEEGVADGLGASGIDPGAGGVERRGVWAPGMWPEYTFSSDLGEFVSCGVAAWSMRMFALAEVGLVSRAGGRGSRGKPSEVPEA